MVIVTLYGDVTRFRASMFADDTSHDILVFVALMPLILPPNHLDYRLTGLFQKVLFHRAHNLLIKSA